MPSHLWTSACALALLFAVQSTASLAESPSQDRERRRHQKQRGRSCWGHHSEHFRRAATSIPTKSSVPGTASVADLKFIDETKYPLDLYRRSGWISLSMIPPARPAALLLRRRVARSDL